MSERSGGRERSKQSGASERVSGASERVDGRTSGPVLNESIPESLDPACDASTDDSSATHQRHSPQRESQREPRRKLETAVAGNGEDKEVSTTMTPRATDAAGRECQHWDVNSDSFAWKCQTPHLFV